MKDTLPGEEVDDVNNAKAPNIMDLSHFGDDNILKRMKATIGFRQLQKCSVNSRQPTISNLTMRELNPLH